MALRFMDSFDHYDSADMTRKWTTVTGSIGSDWVISTANPRNGTQHLRFTDDQFGASKTIDNQATWIVGFGFYLTTVPIASKNICQLRDTGTAQISLQVNADGTLEIRRGGTTGAIGTAVTDGKSSLQITAATWNFIEVKVTIANSISAGTCVVRVNGDVYLTVATGQDLQITGNAFANQFAIGFLTLGLDGQPWDFDDVYICDGTGGAPQNDFLGDCSPVALLPNGNGTTNQFTGSDGNSVDNYLLVDEVPADDDATYVEDSTPGNQDLYAFDNLPRTPVAIFGVQTNIIAKKDDAGARSAKQITRSGVTVYDGDTHTLTQGSYENHECIIEQDPDTAAAWNEAGINAAEFGLETV